MNAPSETFNDTLHLILDGCDAKRLVQNQHLLDRSAPAGIEPC